VAPIPNKIFGLNFHVESIVCVSFGSGGTLSLK